MIAHLVLALLQTTHQPTSDPAPLPERAYQPDIFEPGLGGGSPLAFSRGEFTPDGRLLIAFRRLFDPEYPSASRNALTATLVRPEFLVADAAGNLEGFYTRDPNFTPGMPGPYGENFAFGTQDEQDPDWTLIHWGHELVPCRTGPGGKGLVEAGCIEACPSGKLKTDMRLDPRFPLADYFGSAQLSVAMRPLATDNPYASTPLGVPDLDGQHTTYKLWIVRAHNEGFTAHFCNPKRGGALIRPLPGLKGKVVFVSQEVTVVIDEAAGGIVHTDVEPFEFLTTPDGTVRGAKVHGLEPSITADGRLILFHGSGAALPFKPGNAVVTYIFNPTPCESSGWTAPRSITELPLPSELGGHTQEEFKRFYRLFAHPIRMPRSQLSGASEGGAGVRKGDPFEPGEAVTGTYPWVSKDGAFYNAYSVRSVDVEDLSRPNGQSRRAKSGGYICGDLTGWTIKHIDDNGLNPTRFGGCWAWPWYRNFNGKYPESWGSVTMSTGVRPGFWDPLPSTTPRFPTMEAAQRIPVLPLFLPIISSYGEVRFEEADGNYLLYMACNESLAVDSTLALTRGEAFLIDSTSTPDSSGNAELALCSLNPGAAFPQEVFWNSLPGTYQDASRNLREAIGAELLETPGPFHENVGFKGQGIVLSSEGAIEVQDAQRIGDLSAFTVQLFVKSVGRTLAPRGASTSLFEYGESIAGRNYPFFQLSVDARGVFSGQVYVRGPVGPVALSVATRGAALDRGSLLANPREGWRHVTVTFHADPRERKSFLKIYLDGQLESTFVQDAAHSVANYGFPAYYVVGPGRASNASEVTLANMSLVIDEVALSGLQRTGAEIRRDAFVAPQPSEFGPWPNGLALPSGLDPVEAMWPVATAYDPAIVDLGRQLFHSKTLSASAANPLVSGARACASCHAANKSFTDSPLRFPFAVRGSYTSPPQPPSSSGGKLEAARTVGGGALATFNTPTLINAAFGGHKTFSGVASSIEDQIIIPLTSGTEMGVQGLADVVARVRADESLDFEVVFGAPADPASLTTALAMYLRMQTAGSAPFDRNPGGLSGLALQGKSLFFGKARCSTCHSGSNFSDDAFHNVLTVSAKSEVLDRGGATGRANEIGQLKTPTLRNLTRTAPYFHDGSRATLDAVIKHYNDPFNSRGTSRGKKGSPDRDLRELGLTDQEQRALVAFLQSLSE